MSITSVAAMLARRETGRRFSITILSWLLLGVAVAAADAKLADARLPRVIGALVHDFPDAFAYIVAIMTAVQMISRLSEDRLRGWLLGWCGSGGRRDEYLVALYVVVVAAMSSAFVTSVVGYTAARAVLGGGLTLTGVLTSLAVGTGSIAAVGAYGLMIGAVTPRLAPAITFAALLFFIPVIVLAVIVVTKDLPEAPAAGRLILLHIPRLNIDGSALGWLDQITYIAAAVFAATRIGRARVARVR